MLNSQTQQFKINDNKFKIKQTNMIVNMMKSLPPATPIAKMTQKSGETGSTLYISNRKQININKKFSVLNEQFDVVGVLGSGAYGTTYEVIDKLRGYKHFALKRTTSHTAQSLMEANTLLELDSPCIIALYGCWQEGKTLFVQTSLGSMNLKEILDNYQRIPEDLFWVIAADISNAIEECHKKKIVHLDIKASNILLTELAYFSQKSRSNISIEENKAVENQTPDMIQYGMAQSGFGLRSEPQVIPQIASRLSMNFDTQHLFSDDEFEIPNSPVVKKSVGFMQLDESPAFTLQTQLSPGLHIQIPQSCSLQKIQTAKYVEPLDKLRVKRLEDLKSTTIFQLIDFGLSQHEIHGKFLGEQTCGDSAYVCQKFMQTGKPDYSSDLFSFGVFLLEILSGIELPLNGLLFEQLRSENWLQFMDEDVFGKNFANYVLNGEELIDPEFVASRTAWEAIIDLIHADPQKRLPMQQWRSKYSEQLNQFDRQDAYNQVNKMQSELFKITDSELENRCVVVSKQMRKQLHQKKQQFHKKVTQQLMKSHGGQREQLQKELPDVMSFILKGAKYISKKKRTDFVKQSLRSTVTVIGQNMAQSQPLPSAGFEKNRLEFNNNFDDQSPLYQNNRLNYDFENDFLLGDALEEQFFPSEGQEVKSFVHNSKTVSEKSSFEANANDKSQEDVEAPLSQLSVQQQSIEHLKPEINEVDRAQYFMKIIPSQSEITLAHKSDSNFMKNQLTFQKAMDENTDVKPNLVLSETRISSNKLEQETNTSTYDLSSDTSVEPTKQTAQQHQHSTISQIFYALETITGIASMIYINPFHYYQTPSKPRKSDLPQTEEQQNEKSFTKHLVQSRFIPESGSYQKLKLSELQAQGFQTPKFDQIVECMEQKRQNITCCNKLHYNRPYIFGMFSLVFVPIMYILKFMRMMHLPDQYNTVFNFSKYVFCVVFALFTFGLYQLNQYNVIQIGDPVYVQIRNTELYIDPVKFQRGVVGFILPIGFYFTHWVLFFTKEGDVGIIFFCFLCAEFALLYLLGLM
ncbi:Kinase [Hexamita inflata]|uniref:Kinase n=1 Tax=Hexamita inflata TaxID=28002 RepID=A0AA86QN84_9EUKA|nr:Kinase [Hexamita inflata]